MADLKFESAVDGMALPDGRSFSLRENGTASRLVFRAGEIAREQASEVLGLALPQEACTSAQWAGVAALWLGPDEWLIVTPDDRRKAIERDLRRALMAQHFALTDVSGGQTALHLHGRHVRDVLSKGCPIDFHPRVFGIGQCAQSHLGKAPILIGQIEEQPYYELIVRRSFADYLWTWLEIAAEEYGMEVAS